MPGAELRLAGLLVRRLAHDLSGPLSALSTLAGLGEPDPLQAEATARLALRLDLLRTLFAGLPDAPLDCAHAVALLRQEAGARVRLEAQLAADATPASARAALALAIDLLPMLADGAAMRVAATGAGALEVAAGPLRAPPPPAWAEAAAMRAGSIDWLARLEPALVPTAIAALLAGPLAIRADEGEVRVSGGSG
jgi:hypothetical protein